jgi:ZIP family zinc transporter
MEQEILIILTISVLGPIIGSLIGVINRPSDRFMYNMLAFAGGVMLSISFLELIPESIRLSSVYICIIGIIIGVGIMYILDKLIPHIHPELCSPEQGSQLKRTATYLILGIFLHNIPEGMAIALGEVSKEVSVYAIAFAIAVHNIPEGVCTSAPYFYSTKKRLKAFLLSSSTAIPIVVGFLIAMVLYSYISYTYIGLIVGATAGLMIYITSDEIIPTSSRKITDHTTIFSLVVGILFVVLIRSL